MQLALTNKTRTKTIVPTCMCMRARRPAAVQGHNSAATVATGVISDPRFICPSLWNMRARDGGRQWMRGRVND